MLRATTACNFSSLIWPAGSAPVRFSEPTQIIGKTQCFATFLLFSHLHLLSSYSFSSTLLSSNLSLLSASSLLCFSSVHIVGSLTSKLPSIIYIYVYNIYIYIYDKICIHMDHSTIKLVEQCRAHDYWLFTRNDHLLMLGHQTSGHGPT